MPVIVTPTPELVGTNNDFTVESTAELLDEIQFWAPSNQKYNRLKRKANQKQKDQTTIIQSSFNDLNESRKIIPYGNGLVQGIVRAFQQDLHLVLRPDDIWLTIVIQFSLYINANAESLRSKFVSHEGDKNLCIDITPLSPWHVDAGKFAELMATLAQQNIVDDELRDWFVPSFSTTTAADRAVASVCMLGSLQKYFNFILFGGCGFPSVTLLGEKDDWAEILHRIGRLRDYGEEAEEWSQLLFPVVERMVTSFDEPDSPRIKDFWLRACHSAGRDGSGDVETLSGWITAFNFWSEKGLRVPKFDESEFRSTVWGIGTPMEERKPLTLDGVTYPVIRPREVSKAVVSVPVKVVDMETALEHEITLLAGCIGMSPVGNDLKDHISTVQPRSGWWMIEDSVKRIIASPHVLRSGRSLDRVPFSKSWKKTK
jgi:hypothetical protein